MGDAILENLGPAAMSLIPAVLAGLLASEFTGWAGIIGAGGLVWCRAFAWWIE